MDNRIGRRAAIAGADRMAADDVMGSVLQLLPNEDSQLLRHMPLADGALRAANPTRPSSAVLGVIGAVVESGGERILCAGRAIAYAARSFARDAAAVGEIVTAMPALGRLL